MHPYLDPWHRIPMYGFMIAIGVVCVVLLSLFWHDTKLKRDDAVYSTTFALVGGFIGAKLLSILQNIPAMASGRISFLLVLQSGYVFYGGFIGGLVGIIIYGLVFKINLLTLFDFAALRVPVGQAFGRIGCLCAGCCFGRPTDMPWGIKYPPSTLNPSLNELYGQALHPTQIYETIYCTLIFIVLLVMTSKYFRGKLMKGVVATTYVGLYAVCRFVNEFFRFDMERKFVGAVSTSQFISILLVIGAVAAWIAAILIMQKRKKSPGFAQKFVDRMAYIMPPPPKPKQAPATADGEPTTDIAPDGAQPEAVVSDSAEAVANDSPAVEPNTSSTDAIDNGADIPDAPAEQDGKA